MISTECFTLFKLHLISYTTFIILSSTSYAHLVYALSLSFYCPLSEHYGGWGRSLTAPILHVPTAYLPVHYIWLCTAYFSDDPRTISFTYLITIIHVNRCCIPPPGPESVEHYFITQDYLAFLNKVVYRSR